MFGVYIQPGAGIDAFGQRFHGDTIIDGADTDTQIAAHTFFVFDNKLALPVHCMGDGLMRCIFAGNVALAALDA